MKPDIKEKWLAALRSGEYKQGAGMLRTHDDKFCCLGVLCDLIAPDKWESKWRRFNIQGNAYSVPIQLLPVAGIATEEERDVLGIAASMNDSGTPFLDIADYIEAHL